jgi:hypothetical protein
MQEPFNTPVVKIFFNMRKLFYLQTVAAIMLMNTVACQSQTHKEAKELQKNIETISTPPTVATHITGYYLKAKINGKQWVAKKMVPDTDGSGIVEVIGFNGPDPSKNAIHFQVGMKDAAGKKRQLDDTRIIRYFDASESEGLYIAQTGEINTTRVTDEWMEGTFYGTAIDAASNKTVTITDGYFRVSKTGRGK